jgi:hypothetical protein
MFCLGEKMRGRRKHGFSLFFLLILAGCWGWIFRPHCLLYRKKIGVLGRELGGRLRRQEKKEEEILENSCKILVFY